MGDTLLGKPYGLTHEEMLKAHHALTAIATAKKAPYQLDLEVKDRKPDIVPKVGDKVKIKSREWYEKWKNDFGDVSLEPLSYWGNGDMVKHLGRIYSVKRIDKDCFFLNDCPNYAWMMNMFEEVYPKESSKEVKCTNAFEALSINDSALEDTLEATSVISAINPVQGTGLPIDWSKIISDTAAIITLPDNRPIRARTQAEIERLRDRWLFKEEPELQTIKKHRFIKLEKL